MVFGGLRGAVGLALALILQQTEQVETSIREQVTFHVRVSAHALFWMLRPASHPPLPRQVTGIVGLTLLVNATMAPYVFPKVLPPFRRLPMRLARKSVAAIDEEVSDHKLLLMGQPRFLRVRWELVSAIVPNLADVCHFVAPAKGVPVHESDRHHDTKHTPTNKNLHVQHVSIREKLKRFLANPPPAEEPLLQDNSETHIQDEEKYVRRERVCIRWSGQRRLT